MTEQTKHLLEEIREAIPSEPLFVSAGELNDLVADLINDMPGNKDNWVKAKLRNKWLSIPLKKLNKQK